MRVMGFEELAKCFELSFQNVGATAGITILHHWRMTVDFWGLLLNLN